MKAEDRVRELLVLQEEGALPPLEATELEDLLAGDPAAARALVEHYILTAEFETELAAAQDNRVPLASISPIRPSVPRPVEAPGHGREYVKSGRRRQAAFAAVLLAAAGVLVFVGKGGGLSRRSSEVVSGASLRTAQQGKAALAGSVMLRERRGDVQIVTPMGRRPVEVGAALAAGVVLDVGGDGFALLELEDGTRVSLDPLSVFSLATPSVPSADGLTRRTARLDRGRLQASVSPQRPGHLLVFTTPQARVTVLGTELTVAIDDQRTRVSVLHGRVLFEDLNDGTTLTLGAGQDAQSGVPATARDAASDSSGPGSRDAAGTAVSFWDFEDGVLPPDFNLGQITSAAARPGSRYAIIATLYPLAGSALVLGCQSSVVLVRYSETAGVSFDYWLAREGTFIVVQLRNRAQEQNYQFRIKDPDHERWTHVELRLSDFKAVADRTKRWEPGEGIDGVHLVGGMVGGGPFYADNLKLWGAQ